MLPRSEKIKPLAIATVVILGLVMVGAGGMYGWQWLTHRRVANFEHAVRQFVDAGELAQAMALLNHRLTQHPQDLTALRLGAQICESYNLPTEVLWRDKLFEVSSQDASNGMRLAMLALMDNHPEKTRQVLEAVARTESDTSRYWNLKASLALAESDEVGAIKACREALRLDPASGQLAINLANLLLLSKDAANQKEGWQLVEEECKRQPAEVVLPLIIATLMSGPTPEKALPYSDELMECPRVTLRDEIRHASLLKYQAPERLEKFLELMQQKASTDPAAVVEWVGWILNNKSDASLKLADWLDALPSSVKRDYRVRLARADVAHVEGDWDTSVTVLTDFPWPDHEATRLAHLAESSMRLGRSAEANNLMTQARYIALRNVDEACALVRLTHAFGDWALETESLCWQVFQRFPHRINWASSFLTRIYREAGDTRGLLKLATAWLEIDPDDYRYRNNQIYYSLLLNQGDDGWLKKAEALYEAYPENDVITLTYALALRLKGQGKKAAAIVAKYAGRCRDPEIAATYIIIVANNGVTIPEECVQSACAARLLPEESALLHTAMGKLK